MSQFGTFDNLSDRRDLHYLLSLLDGRARGRFVEDCARRLGHGTHRLAGEPTTGEAYALVVGLAAQYGGKKDLEQIAIRLENIVRGKS